MAQLQNGNGFSRFVMAVLVILVAASAAGVVVMYGQQQEMSARLTSIEKNIEELRRYIYYRNGPL